MKTIDDIISMKNEKNVPFGSQFRWLISEIENNLLSKSDGKERVIHLLMNYDYKAKLFIVHQYFHLGKEQLGKELFSILDLDKDNTFLEDKYIEELLDIEVL